MWNGLYISERSDISVRSRNLMKRLHQKLLEFPKDVISKIRTGLGMDEWKQRKFIYVKPIWQRHIIIPCETNKKVTRKIWNAD